LLEIHLLEIKIECDFSDQLKGTTFCPNSPSNMEFLTHISWAMQNKAGLGVHNF